MNLYRGFLSLYLQSAYKKLPPSLARFSVEEPDVVVYTGYGMQKQIQFYSLSQRKVTGAQALYLCSMHKAMLQMNSSDVKVLTVLNSLLQMEIKATCWLKYLTTYLFN